MIGINHQYNAARDYVLKQARINFGSRSQKYLQFIEKLDKKIAEIRKMELIPFDYEYFKNERAGIKISGQDLDRILNLKGKMNKGDLSTPGTFFTQNSRFHKDDSKLALRPPSSSAKR